MPVSVTTLTHIAALECAVPGLTVRIATDGGGTVVIGDGEGASMCACAFRYVVAQWPHEADHDPCVASVEYQGAVHRGGILATGSSRWFVSDLEPHRTAYCLRAFGSSLTARVWPDSQLGVCVVRVDSRGDADVDELALDAYGAVLVADLVSASPR